MKRRPASVLIALLLSQTALVPAPLLAAETSATAPAAPLAAEPSTSFPAANPNAAVIYWQAFAAIPTLEGEQKTKYEAAIKTLTEPPGDGVQLIVAQFDMALRQLHRAGQVKVCDWNLEYNDGLGMLLPHLGKARELGDAALLRARLRFAAKATDDAVADVVAALKLARDCGSSPVIICELVALSIEKKATDVLVANLGSLSSQQLDRLAAELKALPETPSVADCLRLEGRLFGDWTERFIDAEAAKNKDPKAGGKIMESLLTQVGDQNLRAGDGAEAEQFRKLLDSLTVADVRESLRVARTNYAELARITELRPAERRRRRLAEFEDRMAAIRQAPKRKPEDLMHVLSTLFLPAVSKVTERADQFQVRQQLLLLAIQVQRDGPQSLRNAAVPDHGPVEYRQAADGFELRCRPASAEAPEVLRVGKGK